MALNNFQMCRLRPETRAQVERYAAQQGITIDQALEAVVLEVIGTEGLNRALARMDKDLEKEKPRLELVKTLDFSERY